MGKEAKINCMVIRKGLLSEVTAIITEVKNRALRSVNFERVMMYGNIGKKIYEEEQEGKDRADYGSYLLQYLSNELQPVYGFRIFPKTIRTLQAILSHISNCEHIVFAIKLEPV